MNFSSAGTIPGYLFAVAILFFAASGAYAQTDAASPLPLEKCWSYEAGEIAPLPLASDSENVYFLRLDGVIETVSAAGGQRLWSAELGGEFVSGVLLDGDRILVAAATGGNGGASAVTLRSLSRSTGVTVWTRPLPPSETVSLGRSASNIIAVSSGGNITAVDPATGTNSWSRDLPSKVSGSTYFNGQKFMVGTADRAVMILSGATGDILFETRSRFAPTAMYSSMGKSATWGDERGNLNTYNVDSGKRDWKLKTGAAIAGISGAEDAVLVSSNDNFLYLIDAGSGRVTWKTRHPGRIYGVPVSFGETVVLLVNGENIAAFVDVKSGKFVNRLNLEPGDSFVSSPVAAGGLIIFGTNRGLSAYSPEKCGPK